MVRTRMQKYVAYLRVSDPKQGASGLGIEAQRESVSRYVAGRGEIIAEYVEVETGKRTDRPKLLEALAACRQHRAILLIAKLDRLARNVAFIANLMNSDVEFVAVDMPTANRLTIHILAAVAEHERDLISERTKAALKAAKARGTKLGNPRWPEALEKARAAIIYAKPTRDVLQLMTEWRQDLLSLRGIAQRLNTLGIQSPKGGRWHASTVMATLSRLPEFQKARKNENSKGRNDESVISSDPSFSLNGIDSGATPAFCVPTAGQRTQKAEEMTMAELAEAYRMLDAFASFGARHFDVTFTDIDGQKVGFRREQTARQLRHSLPHLLPGLTERHQNIIIRPYGDDVKFVQLDDLDLDQLKPLAPVSCLIIETSPRNHQAWIAVSDLDKGEAADFARRLRKGSGADPAASGATRLAGTSNYKRPYEPNFPEVKILQAAPGRRAAAAQLQGLGLLAPAEPIYEVPPPFRASSVRNWPDYQRCVLGAPMNHGKTGPDISRADFFWAMMAAQRGHSAEEIVRRLMELSSKAKENGERYAQTTAQNAVAATENQRRSRA